MRAKKVFSHPKRSSSMILCSCAKPEGLGDSVGEMFVAACNIPSYVRGIVMVLRPIRVSRVCRGTGMGSSHR